MPTSSELNAPIDNLQKSSLVQRDWVREQFRALREVVARWEPSPTPEDWR